MIVLRSIGFFIFVALLLAVCPYDLHAETLNRVVAIVNDDVITLYELNQRMREMTGSTPEDMRSENEQRYLETRRKILELMIDEKCAQDRIRELGIKVSEKEIDSAIETIKRRNSWTQEDLLAMLKNEGITWEAYRDRVKTDLERYTLINAQVKSKIIIREEEIVRYYEENKADFGSEESVHLAGIFLIGKNTGDEEEYRELKRKGEDILSRLKNGEDFGKLAKELSQGPGADEGGDLGTFKTLELEPALREALEGIEEGGFTDLIPRANGLQIIKLIKRQRAQVKSFEEVKDTIYDTLYREEVNKRYMDWIRELRKESYTKVIF